MAGLLGIQVASLLAIISVDQQTAWLAASACGVAFSAPAAALVTIFSFTQAYKGEASEPDKPHVASARRGMKWFIYVVVLGTVVWLVGLLGHVSGVAVAALVLGTFCVGLAVSDYKKGVQR